MTYHDIETVALVRFVAQLSDYELEDKEYWIVSQLNEFVLDVIELQEVN